MLVTTLTKRTAEELTDYLRDLGINVRYLHSEIDAIERVEILRALRKGEFDVLVGINLLREGLDLPEVSLVAILDADKEGYLRSATSLIQTAGPRRAPSQRRSHSLRRRDDAEHPEIPRRHPNTAAKSSSPTTRNTTSPRAASAAPWKTAWPFIKTRAKGRDGAARIGRNLDLTQTISDLQEEMLDAANNLEFEKAALLRDQIRELKRNYSGESDSKKANKPSSYKVRRRKYTKAG